MTEAGDSADRRAIRSSIVAPSTSSTSCPRSRSRCWWTIRWPPRRCHPEGRTNGADRRRQDLRFPIDEIIRIRTGEHGPEAIWDAADAVRVVARRLRLWQNPPSGGRKADTIRPAPRSNRTIQLDEEPRHVTSFRVFMIW